MLQQLAQAQRRLSGPHLHLGRGLGPDLGPAGTPDASGRRRRHPGWCQALAWSRQGPLVQPHRPDRRHSGMARASEPGGLRQASGVRHPRRHSGDVRERSGSIPADLASGSGNCAGTGRMRRPARGEGGNNGSQADSRQGQSREDRAAVRRPERMCSSARSGAARRRCPFTTAA